MVTTYPVFANRHGNLFCMLPTPFAMSRQYSPSLVDSTASAGADSTSTQTPRLHAIKSHHTNHQEDIISAGAFSNSNEEQLLQQWQFRRLPRTDEELKRSSVDAAAESLGIVTLLLLLVNTEVIRT